MLPTMDSTSTATIGLMSSGPIGGMNRLKIARYGSQTWRRNSITAFSARL